MKTLYKNHGKSVGYWAIEVTDNAELKIAHARTLDGKETVRLVQVEGKNLGRANETSPLEQAHKELEARVKKQIDKGYVQSLEAADAPAVNSVGLPQPVLATVLEKVKPESIDWDNAYLQPKLNGHRCMFKDGTLYSRGGKEIELPHIKAAITELGLDNQFLDGELYIHGVPLQQIGSLVKKPREESVALEYHVYDCPSSELNFEKRYRSLMTTDILYSSEYLVEVETVTVTSLAEVHELTDQWVSEGFEGSILRHGTDSYEFGKRSRKILKVKNYIESEAEIVGWELKQPVIKEDGRTFQVICFVLRNNFGGDTFEVTAPGNEQQVHEQWRIAKSFVGKQMTFKYFELSDGMVPQQPIALQVREDL